MYIIIMSRIALVTGATRNLGLALARGLAERLQPEDTVYLTGRDPSRVSQAVEHIARAVAAVRGEVLDVSDREAVQRVAVLVAQRHGGIDIVLSNHYMRVQPSDDPADIVDDYVAVNNLGTTRVLRSFAPLLRDGGRLLVVASRAGTLRVLAPALHPRFADLNSLEDVDRAVCAWRDAVRERRAAAEAWPAWINIPSKIGQVAAMRVLARERRADDLRRRILIAALSPGLIDTGASRKWFADMSQAQTSNHAARPLLDFALDRDVDYAVYGELVHFEKDDHGQSFLRVLPWQP
jgi:NAD(P)-dependent dehydrogenase (short-subunit alcohol dehydrogenase family)